VNNFYTDANAFKSGSIFQHGSCEKGKRCFCDMQREHTDFFLPQLFPFVYYFYILLSHYYSLPIVHSLDITLWGNIFSVFYSSFTREKIKYSSPSFSRLCYAPVVWVMVKCDVLSKSGTKLDDGVFQKSNYWDLGWYLFSRVLVSLVLQSGQRILEEAGS